MIITAVAMGTSFTSLVAIGNGYGRGALVPLSRMSFGSRRRLGE